jgi:hypothetical protein
MDSFIGFVYREKQLLGGFTAPAPEQFEIGEFLPDGSMVGESIVLNYDETHGWRIEAFIGALPLFLTVVTALEGLASHARHTEVWSRLASANISQMVRM